MKGYSFISLERFTYRRVIGSSVGERGRERSTRRRRPLKVRCQGNHLNRRSLSRCWSNTSWRRWTEMGGRRSPPSVVGTVVGNLVGTSLVKVESTSLTLESLTNETKQHFSTKITKRRYFVWVDVEGVRSDLNLIRWSVSCGDQGFREWRWREKRQPYLSLLSHVITKVMTEGDSSCESGQRVSDSEEGGGENESTMSY